MKYLIGLIFTSLTISSFGQVKTLNELKGLTIDPTIKKDAEANIKDLKEFEKNLGIQIFESKVALEFYENDRLTISTGDNPKTIISKSFYLWRGDTLIIDGGIGLAVGAGFSLKLIKNNATVYHMLSSDDSPTYAYGEKTNLIYRLEVPCHDVKVVLSGLPEKGGDAIIYGYVEFQSDNFYTRQEMVDGTEMESRMKSRSNMKMYFRSGPLDL